MLPEPSEREFQPGGRAWHPLRLDILELLKGAAEVRVRPLYYGSNHCFLVTLDAGQAGRSLAVYKPASGEYPLYDFPSGTLYRREFGSWLLSELLEWCLVPPTVIVNGKYGPGSLQLYIESRGRKEVNVEHLRRLALLDILLNNADRKAEHCLLDDDGKLWGIDHGLTFHAQPKLRTVLWHFAGDEIRPREMVALQMLDSRLAVVARREAAQLRDLITLTEWNAFRERVQRLQRTGRFPNPRYKSVPYRW